MKIQASVIIASIANGKYIFFQYIYIYILIKFYNLLMYDYCPICKMNILKILKMFFNV